LREFPWSRREEKGALKDDEVRERREKARVRKRRGKKRVARKRREDRWARRGGERE